MISKILDLIIIVVGLIIKKADNYATARRKFRVLFEEMERRIDSAELSSEAERQAERLKGSEDS